MATAFLRRLQSINFLQGLSRCDYGWGTGDTEALSHGQQRSDALCFSFLPAHLTIPRNTYNLFSLQITRPMPGPALQPVRQEMADQKGLQQAKTQNGLLLHVCFSLCQRTIKAIKDQAALLGFEVGPDRTSPFLPWMPRAKSWPSRNSNRMFSGTATPHVRFQQRSETLLPGLLPITSSTTGY